MFGGGRGTTIGENMKFCLMLVVGQRWVSCPVLIPGRADACNKSRGHYTNHVIKIIIVMLEHIPPLLVVHTMMHDAGHLLDLKSRALNAPNHGAAQRSQLLAQNLTPSASALTVETTNHASPKLHMYAGYTTNFSDMTHLGHRLHHHPCLSRRACVPHLVRDAQAVVVVVPPGVAFGWHVSTLHVLFVQLGIEVLMAALPNQQAHWKCRVRTSAHWSTSHAKLL